MNLRLFRKATALSIGAILVLVLVQNKLVKYPKKSPELSGGQVPSDRIPSEKLAAEIPPKKEILASKGQNITPTLTEGESAPEADPNLDPNWLRFTQKFHLPVMKDRDAHIREVYIRLQPFLEHADNWTTTQKLQVGQKIVPITFFLRFYDGAELPRSGSPLRTLRYLEQLSWIAIAYFDLDGKIYRNTASSTIAMSAVSNGYYFVFLKPSTSEEEMLSKTFEYISMPIPGGGAEGFFIAPKIEKWHSIPDFQWAPIASAEAWRMREEWDRKLDIKR